MNIVVKKVESNNPEYQINPYYVALRLEEGDRYKALYVCFKPEIGFFLFDRAMLNGDRVGWFENPLPAFEWVTRMFKTVPIDKRSWEHIQ